jgi:hypothetical protein
VVDDGDLRMAVPADWEVARSTGGLCRTGELPALVLLAPTQKGDMCVVEAPLVHVTERGTTWPGLGWRVDRGLDGTTYDLPGLGLRVSFTNVDADLVEQIVATFTTSSRHRALHDGPVADTAGWQVIDGGGELPVRLLVPPGWDVRRRENNSNQLAPGECSNGQFQQGDLVFVGVPLLGASCPAMTSVLPLADGVWVRPSFEGETFATTPTSVNGHPLRVEQLALYASTVDVVVPTAAGEVVVTVSIGDDPTIARTILTTIEPG